VIIRVSNEDQARPNTAFCFTPKGTGLSRQKKKNFLREGFEILVALSQMYGMSAQR
jgi:hypothetical protein